MKIVIAGSGGHALSTLDLIESLNHTAIGVLDPFNAAASWNNLPIYRSVSEFQRDEPEGFVIAVGNSKIRKNIYNEITEILRHATFPHLVHPTANISPRSTVAEGTCIYSFASVGPNTRIGAFTIINTASHIEHDSTVGNYVTIAPGVTCGGQVEIEDEARIGIGAVISNRTRIGEASTIGASSFVNREIPPRVIAYGIPAVEIRKNEE